MLERNIPISGEKIPVIGLGTWSTFDVSNTSAYTQLHKVLEAMVTAGGRLIDSSPMYGRSEKVVGDITASMPEQNGFFYATKVWTTGKEEGIRQMEASMSLMRRKKIDLMQIHNLLDWKTHLKTLRQWKEEGRIKYIGITHYTDSFHEQLERVLRMEPFDFVQFNYSVLSRNAEKRLLPACKDLGVATIINRPFGEGKLFSYVKDKALPAWAGEFGIGNWGAFFLKFIISHPDVTCVIPATREPLHALADMSAGGGQLPGSTHRQMMIDCLKLL